MESLANRPVILMYHRIAHDTFDPWALVVSPENLSRQAEWLAVNRSMMSLVEFIERHRAGTLPTNAAALTFDDGYACNLQRAVPILERHKLPATLFLPAKLIEQGGEYWWDELQNIVLTYRGEELRLDGETFALGEPGSSDAVWSPGAEAATVRQQAFLSLWSHFRFRDEDGIQAGMDQLRGQVGTSLPPRPSHRPSTSEEIRSIRSDRISFGSHALTHASLPRLSRRQKAREIGESVERCQSLTGMRPMTFAYPFGDADRESIRLVRAAGFKGACITGKRGVEPRTSPFALPRVQVGDWPAEGLAKVVG